MEVVDLDDDQDEEAGRCQQPHQQVRRPEMLQPDVRQPVQRQKQGSGKVGLPTLKQNM